MILSDPCIRRWYSYRASKAATNQIVRALAHELARKHPSKLAARVFAYHPGTVKTSLSEPYVGHRQPDASRGLFSAEGAARKFLEVLRRRKGENGTFVDWKGERIDW